VLSCRGMKNKLLYVIGTLVIALAVYSADKVTMSKTEPKPQTLSHVVQTQTVPKIKKSERQEETVVIEFSTTAKMKED